MSDPVDLSPLFGLRLRTPRLELRLADRGRARLAWRSSREQGSIRPRRCRSSSRGRIGAVSPRFVDGVRRVPPRAAAELAPRRLAPRPARPVAGDAGDRHRRGSARRSFGCGPDGRDGSWLAQALQGRATAPRCAPRCSSSASPASAPDGRTSARARGQHRVGAGLREARLRRRSARGPSRHEGSSCVSERHRHGGTLSWAVPHDRVEIVGLSLPAALRPVASGVAAPVQRDEELELRIDSLAYGGNGGRARLDGFVVFVRRGLPGDTVRARVTKVQRRHAEAMATEVLDAGPERVEAPCAHFPACGGCRFQDLAYAAQLAAKHAWVERLAAADRRASPSRRSSRSSRPRTSSTTATRWSTRSRRAPDGPELGLHRAGRWDEVLEDRALLAHDRPRQRDPQHDARLGARGAARRRTTRRRGTGYLRHLVHPRGREHGPGARPARHPRARALRPRAADRGADAVPARCGRSTGRSTTRRPR